MADHTPYQKNVIKAYYDRRDQIMLERLGAIVTELFLVESERKRDQLWKRAEKAMKALNVPRGITQHIMTRRQPEILAKNLRGWMGKPPQ